MYDQYSNFCAYKIKALTNSVTANLVNVVYTVVAIMMVAGLFRSKLRPHQRILLLVSISGLS